MGRGCLEGAEGWVPLPTGGGVWGGPENFWIFDIKNGELLCILGGIIYCLAACFARKMALRFR